uniref:Uncharacterized protein n=1 Tax=Candidatus Kentrum sp. SD TaxID=2126332 RepID=A0A450YUF0_9GAMM|nr:MAG: hypothetical protein BECKSD772F_GA0070984_12103 [Candidatus Kentron sp. SD]VFK47801.1 MAG: hypothetical protein BECKSD772E_GA0070983_11064 [Candidatus Kentron sp. SD]
MVPDLSCRDWRPALAGQHIKTPKFNGGLLNLNVGVRNCVIELQKLGVEIPMFNGELLNLSAEPPFLAIGVLGFIVELSILAIKSRNRFTEDRDFAVEPADWVSG